MKNILIILTLLSIIPAYAAESCVEIDTSSNSVVGISHEFYDFFEPLGISTYIEQNDVVKMRTQLTTAKQCVQYFIDNGMQDRLNFSHIILGRVSGKNTSIDGMKRNGESRRYDVLQVYIYAQGTVENCIKAIIGGALK